MNIQIQKIRFEKQFPNICLDFDDNQLKYVTHDVQMLFEGWCKAVKTIKEDTFNLYFSQTYGWQLERTADSPFLEGVSHPEFDEQEEAIEYAEKQGWIIAQIEDF
jgi:hypothetical protein